jgi:hypothetical protein
VEQVSLDLQAAFPESKGFSTTNLWYMKQWYTFYSGASEKLAQLGRELPQKKLQQLGGEFQVVENENNIKLHQAVPGGGRGQVPDTGADTGNQILCMNPRPIPVSLSN